MSEEMVKLQGSHAKSEKQIADHKAAVESKTKQHRDAEDRFSALETAHMALQREHKELHKGHQEHQATAKALQQELAGQSVRFNFYEHVSATNFYTISFKCSSTRRRFLLFLIFFPTGRIEQGTK